MSANNHAVYQLATKALLYKGDKVLVLQTPDGYIDFPGGRVDESEQNLPWEDALRREIAEEIGESLRMEIQQILFVSKRAYHKDNVANHIAAIFFKCKYISGEIELSDEHAAHRWLTIQELHNDQNKFMSEDEKRQIKKLNA
jgi:8-oxo-dGTP diphosphatase